MVRSSGQERASTAGSIVGGFVLVPIATLMGAWRSLGVGDFRTWLACWEIRARRQGLDAGRSPNYSTSELAKLLGVSERRTRASVRRLVSAGLIEWSLAGIEFPEPVGLTTVSGGATRTPHPNPPPQGGRGPENRGRGPEKEGRALASDSLPPCGGGLGWGGEDMALPENSGTPEQVLEAEDQVNDSIGRGRGSLAIPRRLLRFLAGGARPALIAAALGILLRCLSRRRDGFDGRGRVKASWIAGVFGVSIPAVKTARRELIALDWVESEAAEQWSLNRWGRAYRIDLNWEAPRPEGSRTIPPRPEIGASLIPPDLQTWTPSGRTEHQEPASSRPEQAGDWLAEGGIPGQAPAAAATLPTPSLADVQAADLKDTARTLELHDQAAAKGLVGRSEADRLKFVALAEHARQVGQANPPGLFSALLRRGAWAFITTVEEDAARRKLRTHDRGRSVQENLPERERPRFSTFVPDDRGFENRRAEMLRQLAGRQ